MKQRNTFSSIILVGFGCYFLIEQLPFEPLKVLLNWPTLFIIVGLAMLGQAFRTNEHQSFFNSIIFVGTGLYFHLKPYFPNWPNDAVTILLITSCALIVHAVKTKAGLPLAALVSMIALALAFTEQISLLIGTVEHRFSSFWKFWPLLLISVGLYILFLKKK